MTFCMNKIGLQTRRQIVCQVHRLSTATMTDNISQIKGQPNTQMLLLENYNWSSAFGAHSCQVHPMGAHGTWLRHWARQKGVSTIEQADHHSEQEEDRKPSVS